MSRQLRPRPADFADRYREMGVPRLVEHYTAGRATVRRWVEEIGMQPPVRIKGKPARPCPPDFARYAGIETNDELMRRYDCKPSIIWRWRRETGIASKRPELKGPGPRPVPDNFRALAARLNREELRVRYGVSGNLIDRWLRECGLKPLGRRQNALQVVASMGKRKVASAMVAPSGRDTSDAGRAAYFLQRRGPIYRCDAEGRFKLGGSHWKWRGRAHTDGEIIAEARERGFDPDAWREVAA